MESSQFVRVRKREMINYCSDQYNLNPVYSVINSTALTSAEFEGKLIFCNFIIVIRNSAVKVPMVV